MPHTTGPGAQAQLNMLAAVSARLELYRRKQARHDPLAPDDANSWDRVQHTIEALEHMLAELEPYAPRVVLPPAAVQRVETVPAGHPFTDQESPPLWRVQLGELCVDFDYEQAARNWAGAINALVAPPAAAQQER